MDKEEVVGEDKEKRGLGDDQDYDGDETDNDDDYDDDGFCASRDQASGTNIEGASGTLDGDKCDGKVSPAFLGATLGNGPTLRFHGHLEGIFRGSGFVEGRSFARRLRIDTPGGWTIVFYRSSPG